MVTGAILSDSNQNPQSEILDLKKALIYLLAQTKTIKTLGNNILLDSNRDSRLATGMDAVD